MRYVTLILTLALLVTVAGSAFAAGPQAKGRLPLAVREYEQLSKSTKAKPVMQRQVARETEPVLLTKAPVARTAQAAKLTKGTVPPQILSGGLSGTWQVGSANQFKTIHDIAFLLNIANINGPVIFELTDPSYTETGVAIGASPGSSATNNIIIRPAAGNTNCVITLSDDTLNGGGLVFDGATFVTVEGTAVGQPTGERDLTIALSGYPAGTSATFHDAPVRVRNGDHITVPDCIIAGGSPAQAWNGGNGSVVITADPGLYNNEITVNNSELSGGHYGVLSIGNYLTSADVYGVQDSYINVTNNYIHDVTEVGIDLQQVTGARVVGNTVKRVVLGSGAGASPNLLSTGGTTPPSITGTFGLANYPLLYRVSGITVWGDQTLVANNLVDSVYNNRTSAGTFGAQAFGIRIIAFGNNDPDPEFGGGLSMAGVVSGNMVASNIVTRIFSNAFQNNGLIWHEVGIKLESGRWDTVVYNTVYLTGNEGAMANPGSAVGLVVEGVTTTPPSLFGANAGFPVWTLGQALNLFSYRVISKDNIFAINRTGTSGVNSVMGLQFATSPSGYGVDYRPPSDNNVLYMGSPGTIAKTSKGDNWYSLYDFVTAMAAIPYVVDQNSQADDPTLVSESDVHINPAGFSTADGTGIAYPGITKDFAGVTRGTPPDIGAYEGTGAGAPHDVKPLALLAPVVAGVPMGLGFTPFQVSVLNLTSNTETGAPINVHIVAPDLSTSDFPGTFTVGPFGVATATINGPWTPNQIGNYTLTISTNLSTDNYHSNDTIVAVIPAVGQKVATDLAGYSTDFESPAAQDGWSGTGAFVLGTPHKTPHTDDNGYTMGGNIEGAHSGTTSWVTYIDGLTGSSTPQVQNLFSPYFDLSGLTSGYLSFYHFISTEPMFDGCDMEYSVDTGKTWKTLGTKNDPNGINWYDTTVYANITDHWNDFDHASANTFGFAGPPKYWTSNGHPGNLDGPWDDKPTGPFGYIFAQIQLPADAVGKPFIRFRYRYFSDAGGENDGTSFDDFSISHNAVVLNDVHLTGKVYMDVDGSQTYTPPTDTALAGVQVDVKYFGAHLKFGTTDALGNYDVTVKLPGTYQLYAISATSLTDTPAVGYAVANNTGTSVSGLNIGQYVGSVSGEEFEDVNNNDTLNVGEGGLANWTINVKKDSVNGPIVGTGVTNVSGNYSILLIPGHYFVEQVMDSSRARQTFPAPPAQRYYEKTVSGSSNGVGAIYPGLNFGNFILGTLKVKCVVDYNGNGVKDLADNSALPGVASEFFQFAKVGNPPVLDTLGHNDLAQSGHSVDTGSYYFKRIGTAPAGWIRTTLVDSFGFKITHSSQVDSALYMDFMLNVVSGNIYEDVTGNGSKDGGDGNLAGITVNLTGAGGGTTTTDANGNYSFNAVAGGAHTLSEVLAPGWTSITPVGGSYGLTLNSANFAGGNPVKNFGNFKNVVISGIVYRDRNGNGSRDLPQDDGFAGSLVVTSQHDTATADANGAFVLSVIPKGSVLDTIVGAIPAGFTMTQPLARYHYNLASGGTYTNQLIGYFQTTDSKMYRTFAAADFEGIACAKTKPGVQKKAGKAADPAKNSVNVANAMVKAGSVQVGHTGVAKGGFPWFLTSKLGDLEKTLCDKNAKHTAAARGFDISDKGKVLSGMLKSLSPNVKNDHLVRELVALKINLALSVGGNTPTGLGALKYYNPGTPFDGMTIDQIADTADGLVSNWGGVPYAMYVALDAAVDQINGAFLCGTVNADQHLFDSLGTVSFLGCVHLTDVTFLKANPGVAPENRHITDYTTPVTYALNQNYPNPFNPTTAIGFDLPQASIVTVKVYNVLGQEIATLVDHVRFDAAGSQEVTFDATGRVGRVPLSDPG